MGWVSPTGFVDSGNVWTDETLAYDNNTLTFAYVSCPAGWCDYLELTIAEITCDKVQIWMGIVNTQVTTVEVDVFYNSTWNNIYSGAIVTGSFQEFAIGSEQLVTAMRVRFSASKTNRQAEVYEADFWEVSAIPTGTVYLVKATGKRTQEPTGAVAIRIDPSTGRRGLDSSLTKYLVRESDGRLKAK